MDTGMAVLAGSISSIIFAGSVMPMIIKAVRTRDLSSYSLGNLLLANTGNLVHSLYIYSLPLGPIWLLHGFYLVTTGFMLAMYLRHAGPHGRRLHHPPHAAEAMQHDLPDAGSPADLIFSDHPGGTAPHPTKE